MGVVEDIELSEETSFEQMLNESFEKENEDSVVDGIVVEVKDDCLLVDVGHKVEGRLNINEVTVDGEVQFKEGDKIPVVVLGSRGERPNISHKKVIQKQKFNEFIEKYGENFEDLVLEVKIVSLKKRAGYIVVDSEGMEYFMPLTQSYVKQDEAIGKTIKVKVLKVNKEQNTVIVSRKKLIEESRKLKEEKVAALLEKDEPITGEIKKITSYGMFVDLGGVDGLVNYKEISYKGPVNPAEYYNEGDEVTVKVIDFDKKKGHIALSIKAVMPDPWEEIKDELEVGDTITVTVSNFESYGAFVDLGNDIEGLLHISEISWNKNIKKPSDVLNIGDEINVEVIDLDVEKKKLRVSLKNLQEKPFSNFVKKYSVGDTVKGKIATITNFGAFVTVDNVDGLLHNEEASWDSTKTCKSLFKKGDEVEAKIIKIDQEKENVSLSIKDFIDSPAAEYKKSHKVGDIIKSTIKDIKEFGVFVKLIDNLDGLIRNEDLAPLNKEELKKGDEIEAVISNIDTKRNKVRLSVKRLERQKERDALSSLSDNDTMTLGDLIQDKISQ